MREKIGILKHARYTFKFIRELSSFFIALYSIYFLLRLYFKGFSISAQLQFVIAFIALFFALYHSITWFYLLPKILKPKKMSEKALFAGTIAFWIVISIIVVYLLT